MFMNNKNDIINNTFDDFCAIVPTQIREYIAATKDVLQCKEYHPEVWVYDHIRIVFNRAKRTKDINLMVAAIFHDLGKVTTTERDPISGKWTSKLHEKFSVDIVEQHRNWIESIGANFEIVLFIVKQHMRAKKMDEMRKHKRMVLMEDPYYPYVEKFTELDDMKIDYSNDID